MERKNGIKKLFLISIFTPLLLLLQIAYASAGVITTLQTALGTNTGRWATELGTATGTGSTTSYQITWTGNANKQYELMSIINVGNFDITQEHFTYASAKANGSLTNPPILTFELCSGTWDTATFLCSGTITQVGSGTGGTIDISRYVIASNRLVVRITNARNNQGNHFTTFDTQTYRSDIRFGIGINS